MTDTWNMPKTSNYTLYTEICILFHLTNSIYSLQVPSSAQLLKCLKLSCVCLMYFIHTAVFNRRKIMYGKVVLCFESITKKKSHNTWKVHKTYPYMTENTVTRWCSISTSKGKTTIKFNFSLQNPMNLETFRIQSYSTLL